MITRNIIFILIIIVIIGLIVYSYYNRCEDIPYNSYPIDNKKVRFNNKVQYNTMSPVTSEIGSSIDYKQVPKINVDSILSSSSESPAENQWDSNFNSSLIDKGESDAYYEKILKENNIALKSMDKYTNFKDKKKYMESKKKFSQLEGQTIKDIYDDQVSNISAIPKKIKNVRDNEIIYDDESENNGGNVLESNLFAYDKKSNLFENYEKDDF